MHWAACPPVSTANICAKSFVSCLINDGDFTVQLFLIHPFRSCRKRINNDFNWRDIFLLKRLKDPTECAEPELQNDYKIFTNNTTFTSFSNPYDCNFPAVLILKPARLHYCTAQYSIHRYWTDASQNFTLMMLKFQSVPGTETAYGTVSQVGCAAQLSVCFEVLDPSNSVY
jgi:hypothetical protein